MKTYIISDIHGKDDLFEKLLKKCNFDLIEDKLICLGDYGDIDDNYYGVYRVLNIINNKILLIGSHDKKMIPELDGYYHLDDDNNLFVHAGIVPEIPLKQQEKRVMTKTRSMFEYAQENSFKEYNKVFVGHTTTQRLGKDSIFNINNVYFCDTGAKWGEKLSIIRLEDMRVFSVK